VTFTWTVPSDGGSPITAVRLYIRESDEVTFTQDLTDCDGADQRIIDAMSCTVHTSRLLAEPFALPWGSSIHAQVVAHNAYGVSEISPVDNGAIILTIPDTPIKFVENQEFKTPTTIGLSWQKPISVNGGTDILDYRINYDQGTGSFVMLAQGIT